MSEPILMALVQLFAIIAASVKQHISENSRKILESYLDQHLNAQELEEYLKLFDELVLFHQPEDGEISKSVVQEKTTAICQRIKKQLTAIDRTIVFIKFLEFLEEIAQEQHDEPGLASEDFSDHVNIFKTAFNAPEQEFRDAVAFVMNPLGHEIHADHLLIISAEKNTPASGRKHLYREHLNGMLLILFIPSVRIMICRYLGNDELFLNGHVILPKRSFVFSNGTILKNLKIVPVYYADAASRFLQSLEKVKVEFTAREVEYRFKNSVNGIHPFSFTA
jgi:hypothetical protein